MKSLAELFGSFFKIGLFSFGGGLAMVPLFVVEFERRGWLTSDQFYDILSLAQMTPGAIAVNSATYVGNDVAGIFGGLFATTGLAAPSVISILILSHVLRRMKGHPLKEAFFTGMKPVSLALILYAGISIAAETFINFNTWDISWKGVSLCLVSGFMIFRFKQIHPIVMILASALAGLFIF